MRIPARLLAIALLATGLFLPAQVFTHAQQTGTITVRPRVTATQPGVPEVTATVDRNRVPLGNEVTFTLAPAGVVMDSRYKVTLYFGDGERCAFRDDPKCQVMRQTEIVHRYTEPGTYTYSILVEPSGPQPKSTAALPMPAVKLFATPASVDVNRSVSFAAQPSHSYPNIKYRFFFGDGSDSGWQDDAKTTHAYRSPNTYQAYVDIGVPSGGSIKQTGGSPRHPIRVNESQRPPNVSVKLIARPTSIDAGNSVTFTARADPTQSNVRYRFDFGDQSVSDWQVPAQAKHKYDSAGRYVVRVEARLMTRTGPQSASSNPVSIEVKNPKPIAKPTAKAAVGLKVIPESVPEGLPVFFTATGAPANLMNRYRFDFGDGSPPSAWSSEPNQTHTYASAGTYPAFVQMATSSDESTKAVAVSVRTAVRVTPIRPREKSTTNGNPNANGNTNSSGPKQNTNIAGNRNSNAAGGSNANANLNANLSGNANVNTTGNSNLNANSNSNATGNSNSNTAANSNSTTTNTNSTSSSVSPSASDSASPPPAIGPVEPPSDWWKYIIIGAIILFGAYQAAAFLFPPRPTFVPHFDPGDSSVGADQPLAINLQVDVDPNVAAGEFRLDTEGGSLIKSERSSDD